MNEPTLVPGQKISINMTAEERAYFHNLRLWIEMSKKLPFILGVHSEQWPQAMHDERARIYAEYEALKLPELRTPVVRPLRILDPGPCD